MYNACRTVTPAVEGMYSFVTMYKAEMLHLLQKRECIVMLQCTRQNCYTCCTRGNVQLCYNVQGRTVTPAVVEGIYSYVTMYKAELLHLSQRECIVMLQSTRQNCYTCSRGNVQLCYNVQDTTVTHIEQEMYSYVIMCKTELLYLWQRECIVMFVKKQNCHFIVNLISDHCYILKQPIVQF